MATETAGRSNDGDGRRRQASLLRLSTAIASAGEETEICHAVADGLYDEALGEFNKANKQPKAADAAHTDAEEHKAREGSAAGRCIRCSDAGNCDVLEEGDEGAERGVGGRLEGPQYRDALSEMADTIPAINWSKDAGLLLIQELT